MLRPVQMFVYTSNAMGNYRNDKEVQCQHLSMVRVASPGAGVSQRITISGTILVVEVYY